MKKLVCMLLAALLCMSIAGCGGGNTAQQTTQAAQEETQQEDVQQEDDQQTETEGTVSTKDTLIIANSMDVSTFDPHVDTVQAVARIDYNIHQTLWLMKDDGSINPVLATEWEWLDDLHLNITLREGVSFSNGNPFTAEDVMFTLEHGSVSALSSYYSKVDLEKSEIVDDYHINLVFNAADPTFMFYMGNVGTGAIIDKETTESDPDGLAANPVGTGPYMMTSWVVGDSVTLEANPGYWGEAPIIKTVVFRAIPDETQREIELKTGNVDMAYEVSPMEVDSFDTEQFVVDSYSDDCCTMLFMNTNEGKATANELVRKAIKYCIDKQAIASTTTNGLGDTAWTIYPTWNRAFNEKYKDYDPYPQDFAKAKECLAEAGYPDGIKLNMIWMDSPLYNPVAEMTQSLLKEAGIELNLQKTDIATMFSVVMDPEGDWDLFVLGTSGYSSGCCAIDMSWFDRAIGVQFAKFNDEEFYSMLDKLFSTGNEEEQIQYVKDAQEYYTEHVGSIPVAFPPKANAYVKNMHGYDIWDIHCCPIDLSKVYFD